MAVYTKYRSRNCLVHSCSIFVHFSDNVSHPILFFIFVLSLIILTFNSIWSLLVELNLTTSAWSLSVVFNCDSTHCWITVASLALFCLDDHYPYHSVWNELGRHCWETFANLPSILVTSLLYWYTTSEHLIYRDSRLQRIHEAHSKKVHYQASFKVSIVPGQTAWSFSSGIHKCCCIELIACCYLIGYYIDT